MQRQHGELVPSWFRSVMPSPVCPARSWSSPRSDRTRAGCFRWRRDDVPWQSRKPTSERTTETRKIPSGASGGRCAGSSSRASNWTTPIRRARNASSSAKRPVNAEAGSLLPLAQTPRTVGVRVTEADRGGSGKRIDNKTQPKTRIKTPDSLRQGASQAAGAAPTIRIRQQVQNALAAAREGLARADHELRVRRLASTGRRRQCYLPSCTGR